MLTINYLDSFCPLIRFHPCRKRTVENKINIIIITLRFTVQYVWRITKKIKWKICARSQIKSSRWKTEFYTLLSESPEIYLRLWRLDNIISIIIAEVVSFASCVKLKGSLATVNGYYNILYAEKTINTQTIIKTITYF